MKEYIERAAVSKACKASGSVCTGRDCEIPYVPTADVAPVRHGRWIGEEIDIGGHIGKECSECHKVRIIDEYCSACGARMDKEDEHEAD